MPMFEFKCSEHPEEKVERLTQGHIEKQPPFCDKCGRAMEQIEYSIPAKRNPDKGIQR